MFETCDVRENILVFCDIIRIKNIDKDVLEMCAKPVGTPSCCIIH